jgi:hypothetical protein
VEQQVDELADLDVIDGDLGITGVADHEIALFCSLQLQIPCRNP